VKGYRFSLNRVLDVRVIEEKIARNKLLQERQKARIIENELEELNNGQQKLYEYLRKNGTVNENTLQARSYLYRQRGEIEKTEEKLTLQLERVARSNKEFIERKQNKEVLEKLKEKEYQKFYKELLDKEQKLIDEISLQVKRNRW